MCHTHDFSTGRTDAIARPVSFSSAALSAKLLGGLGVHLGFLRIIEDITLRFPPHLTIGFVVYPAG
jgi:hypothetical protein